VTAFFRNERDDIIKLHVGEQIFETTNNHPLANEVKLDRDFGGYVDKSGNIG
jgi:hypothetical protein